MPLLLIFLATILAFWISAICGGGASLVLIPLLGLSVSGSQVPAALTLGTFSSSLSRLAVFRNSIHWPIVFYYVPAGIPTVWIGAWALKYFNPIYLQFFIGIFLLVNVRFLLLPKNKIRQEERPSSRFTLILIGAIAGFVSGLTGAVGLLFNRFYLKYGLTKEEIVATRAANDILLHVIKLILYGTMGLISTEIIQVGVVIAIGAMISSISIKRILPLINENLFRRIGYSAMAFSGCALLISTSTAIIKTDNPSIHLIPMGNSIETQIAWRSSLVNIELEYDEGIHLEHPISFDELPPRLHPEVRKLTANADRVIYEKVTGFQGTSYEVYVTKNGQVSKSELD